MDDGSTARQHAEAFERQTGLKSPELNGPELPPDLAHVWGWFLELHARRGSNGFGSNPLAWGDLLAWSSLTRPGIRLAELQAILMIDNAWMASQAEEALSKERARKQPKPPGRR